MDPKRQAQIDKQNEMAQLAAERIRGGKSADEFAKDFFQRERMKEGAKSLPPVDLSGNAPTGDDTQEYRDMRAGTDAGYDYTKKRDYKKGGKVKMAAGGSASKRADGCAVRGKTKGRMV
jgi:hypothetical protein